MADVKNIAQGKYHIAVYLEKWISNQTEGNQGKQKSSELENGLVPLYHCQLAGIQSIVKGTNFLCDAWKIGPKLIGTHEEVAQ